MIGGYDVGLVVLSIVVAMMASYSALDLAGRVTLAVGRAAVFWLLGGAIVMGAGIWSMHFIGMLAFSLPIPMGYDPSLTFLSMLIAMVTSGFALAVVSRTELRVPILLSGGVIMGAGICGMHYTGMAAMQMQPPIQYDPRLFAASVAIAVGAAIAALWLAYNLRSGTSIRVVLARVLAAVVMGFAITGMHYTGMAAAQFAPGALCTAVGAKDLDGGLLGYTISVVAICIIGFSILASVIDARMASQTVQTLKTVEAANLALRQKILERDQAHAELRASEAHFRTLVEQADDGILILSREGRYLDVNRRTVEMLGYTREELMGAMLDLLIAPADRPNAAPEFAKVLEGRQHQTEWTMLRKDGSTFLAECSSKSLTDGRVLTTFREITERKAQEERIHRLNRMHGVVSGTNSLIVRCRNRQDLFEGVCRFAVEKGRFKLAWVGLVENETVRPAAFHGDDGGALQSVRISMRDDGTDSHDNRSLTAQALREQSPAICNDIVHDERTQHWPQASRGLGYGSFLSLPLFVDKRVAGCLNLYAIDVGFFDDEEVKLLTELSANISYAMEFITKKEQLDYLDYYDPLTRLANRRQLIERLDTFVQTARQERKPLAVLEIDLENFKFINDAFGRGGGDEVLRRVAHRLTEIAGSATQVARTAGDRFVVVVESPNSNADLMLFAEQDLVQKVGLPMQVAGRELRLTIKVGIALFPDDGEDPESLVRNAEAAVKGAKQGGNRCLFYAREMGVALFEKLTLESQLRQAIEKQQFVLYYQPKVELSSGAIVGAEALIRWNSPELGLVPPTKFIPLLEDNGMIVEVGRWAMEQAVRDHRAWVAAGLPAPSIAVNVSPVQWRNGDFVATVRAVLSQMPDIRPCLDLEITESMLVGDIDDLVVMLKSVRDLGVQIAIDDFGTGYSSLSYLARLPINTLKIDRAFVLSMCDSADTMSIVSTILTLAHSMSLKVVAEGVDSQEQLKFLRLMRCDQIQGWLFSKALPADEFAQLLREDRKL